MDFNSIFKNNTWSGKETRSGPGSSKAATRHLVGWLPGFIEQLGVGSILDLPCGEGTWFPDIPGVEYFGADIVPGAVAAAQRRNPLRTYYVLDGRTDPLPKVDLIFSRDCMQHLSVPDGQRMLDNFVRSGATYLIASTYLDGDNAKGPESHYHAYRVNLSAHPFSLGEPVESIEDGFGEDGFMKDKTKEMGVWKLR